MSTMIDKNGTVYKGTFVEGVLHGMGEMITKNGIKYNGFFIHGKKHGMFTVTYTAKKQICTILYEYDTIVDE